MQAWNPFRKLTGLRMGPVAVLSGDGDAVLPLRRRPSPDSGRLPHRRDRLIFVAKGEVLGQILTVVFSLAYAAVSLRFRYYGEMITYLGMTAPIAVMSVVSWLKHPYQAGKSEVAVARLTAGQIAWMSGLGLIVTVLFYFILAYFETANLLVSTVSILTSFLASYLMFCRSPAYALAYAANDLVLIVLWVLAAMDSLSYLPMVVCFAMFFCNDLYGFYNWRRMRSRQQRCEGA